MNIKRIKAWLRFGVLTFIVCFVNAYAVSKLKAQATSPLTINTIEKWPTINNASISNDGQYVFYIVSESRNDASTLIVKSLFKEWKLELAGVISANFSCDNRFIISLHSNDSLNVVSLGNSIVKSIANVRSFNVFSNRAGSWLIYHLKDLDKALVLFNLQSNEQRIYNYVNEYIISRNSNVLILKQELMNGAKGESLTWIDMAGNTSKSIRSGIPVNNIVFDAVEGQIAFLAEAEFDNKKDKVLYWYNRNKDSVFRLSNKHLKVIDSNYVIEGISKFVNGNKGILVSLREKQIQMPNDNLVKLDVWNYRDVVLQSEQLSETEPKQASVIITLNNDSPLVFIQSIHDRIMGSFDAGVTDYFWVNHCLAGIFNYERNWNNAAEVSSFVISSDGKKKKMPILIDCIFSKDGKYLLGKDVEGVNIYSFEISSGKLVNLTKSLPLSIGDAGLDRPSSLKDRGLIFANCWLADGRDVLIYDKFDIWKMDPQGIKSPVNLTNGFGRKHKIVLRLLDGINERKLNNGEIILTAFNELNKENGFYSLDISKGVDPRLLTMGSYIYYAPSKQLGELPIKARDTDVYLIQRQSAIQSPNYFWTKDFIHYFPVSDVYPEKKFNWVDAGLKTFKTLDGRNEHGILYKPQNFDPNKKYPVIIHYYERKSHELNKYQKPGWLPGRSGGSLDIALFVSNGYIVFIPDIHYKIGEPGQSAFNSIMAAAQYLAQFKWVDSKRMGIQGNSFGAYETNYVIAHSNLFAAACATSGVSNFISNYGSLRGGEHGGGIGNQWAYELEQGRIGNTLWERPDLFIKNSPIFRADKVTTPLLMVANKKDGNVSFFQGVEWFTALRRLGKQVWMLQYDNQGHNLVEKARIDYVIRMKQFFDHYLMATLPPKWMTRGIPAIMKGIDDGLELDTLIKSPLKGLSNQANTKRL